jgi:hypothetical protein
MLTTVEKWLAGVTALAIIATVVSNRNSASVINSVFGGIGNVYQKASGR